MSNNDKRPTFEDAFTELRATVEALEAGNLSLEDATALYEKGMRLAKQCNEQLSKAELQVSRLQRSFGEQMAMIQAAEADLPEAPDDDEGEQ
ncbi:MAG: exodeoxyribonuclease VII small subunit [Planctomycetota bacterium]|nr:exodeoxyribonuclease VII small subunit [Planctomycetota bacterium]